MADIVRFLKNKIFKVDEFAQFELLFSSMAEYSRDAGREMALLERAYIYGRKSIFSAMLTAQTIPTVIDFRPRSAGARQNFQGSWIDEVDHDFRAATEVIEDDGVTFKLSFDTLACTGLAIPNILHHCRDFPSLISLIDAAMPKLESIYIFDSYIRENHQNPDDYCRYTPSALEAVLQGFGFNRSSLVETGNVFDAMLYLMSQSKRILEERSELDDIRESLNALEPRLKAVRSDERYRGLGRPHASLATAYAMIFTRSN